MRESVTYQAILEEGRQEGVVAEAREFLLLLGESHLGTPTLATRATIEAINDVSRLHELGLRVSTVGTWKDLLQAPGSPAHPSRSRRRSNGNT